MKDAVDLLSAFGGLPGRRLGRSRRIGGFRLGGVRDLRRGRGCEGKAVMPMKDWVRLSRDRLCAPLCS